jgi:hypothetical protein
MRNRTVLIVLAIAVLLLAFIVFFERDTMTTDELAGRQDRVFVEFRRELVERIAIVGTAGIEVAVERTAGSGEEAAQWRIVSPLEVDADESAVRGVLGAIDFLLKDRTVTGADVAADPRYGLNAPRVKGSYTIGGRAVGFSIGADSNDGQKVYVALDDHPDEFYAVEREFFESIDLGLDDLRDKHLVSRSISDALSITCTSSGELTTLRRQPAAAWRIIRQGQPVLAAEDQVNDLLSAIGRLQAQRFVGDAVAERDLSRFGLATPSRTVTVTTSDEGEPLRLLLGAACPDERQIHAMIAGTGTVACVADDIAELLDRPSSRLSEMRVAVFRDDDVSRIEIARMGKKLALERDDDLKLWALAGDDAPAVEQGTVGDLLAVLRETRASELVLGEAALTELGQPAAVVTLELDAGQEPIEIRLHRGDQPDRGRARRGEEQAVLVVGTKLLDLARPDPLAFRERAIEHGQRDDVVSLAIEGAIGQRLKRDGDGWALVEPIPVPADAASARELAGLIAVVEAERFVASSADSTHGLEPPWATVTARFVAEKETAEGQDRTGEREVILDIGSQANEATRYARIRGGDGIVLTVGEPYLTLVSRPLAARDLLQLPDTELVKIELARADGTLAAELVGDSWTATGAEVSSQELKRIITDLGALKAIRADRFSVPADPVGANRATMTLKTWTRAQLEQKTPAILYLGAPTNAAHENGHFAWKQDLDITFVLPARIVEDLARLGAPGA